MNVRDLDGLDLIHFLQEHGLHPVSSYAVVLLNGLARCTCSRAFDCSAPGKHPVGAGWHQQTGEQAVLRLSEHLDWNIGHATGTISQSIILDVDDGPRLVGGREVTKQGYASLRLLERRLGVLPPTVSWITGSGTGEQRVFHIPPGTVTPRNSAGSLGPDIDIRGEGASVCSRPPATRAAATIDGATTWRPAKWRSPRSPRPGSPRFLHLFPSPRFALSRRATT